MANPFNTQNTDPTMQLKNVYKMLVESKNPQQVFERIAMNNPKMQPIVQALQNGNNPQQIFKSMCYQRGIDPDAFIKSIIK